MRKLDRALHQEVDSAERKHLEGVLERYADWLERLPEAERRQVTEAPDPQSRLKKIKKIREEQWLARQPRAVRERAAALRPVRPAVRAVGAARAALPWPPTGAALAFAVAPCPAAGDPHALLIAALRQEERRRRQEWQIALRHWDDLVKRKAVQAGLADFDGAVEKYGREYLYPMLSKDEKDRLEKAEGQWPLYPYTLVELADRHPPALPGAHGPTTFKELPTDVQERLRRFFLKKQPKVELVFNKQLKAAEGRWPGFAGWLTDYVGKRQTIHFPNEFWAFRKQDLSPGMQDFLAKKLLPKLDEAEKKLLTDK